MISIILVLIVVGVLLYLLNNYIPMAAPVKTIVNVLIVVAVILWTLNALGIVTHTFHVGHL